MTDTPTLAPKEPVENYQKWMNSLFFAIKGYKSECENPCPDLALKKHLRDEIFRCYERLESMGK